MAIVFNPFTGNLDFTGTSQFKGVLASVPASADEGDSYINSGNDTYYVYYSGQWQVLHVLYSTPPIPVITGNPFGLWLPFWRTYQV